MKKRNIALLLSLVLLVTLLCGCGAHSYTSNSAKEDSAYAPAYYDDYYYAPAGAAYGDYWADEAPAAYEEEDYYEGATVPTELTADYSGSTQTATTVETNPAKLIYTADLELETLDFDAAVQALDELTQALGGYYESSSMNDSGSYRRAYYTVRIPAGNYRAFLDDAAGENCHVLSKQEYTEDVSERYYDTAGRLETQQTKLARLQQLLLEAEDMADIITIESAISETEELIDRLSGQLRRYDALVDYSTVDISLREVKVYEPEPDPTYGTRLGSAFVDGLKGFAEGLGDILIALAYSWLWLVLIAAVVVLVLWLTRKRRAALKAERAEKKAARKAMQEAAQNAPIVYSSPSAPEKKDE